MNEDNNEFSSTGFSDEKLDNLFRQDLEHVQANSQRVQQIMQSARRETGLRDLFTHTLLRIWIPVLSIGARFFTFIQKTKHQNK